MPWGVLKGVLKAVEKGLRGCHRLGDGWVGAGGWVWAFPMFVRHLFTTHLPTHTHPEEAVERALLCLPLTPLIFY